MSFQHPLSDRRPRNEGGEHEANPEAAFSILSRIEDRETPRKSVVDAEPHLLSASSLGSKTAKPSDTSETHSSRSFQHPLSDRRPRNTVSNIEYHANAIPFSILSRIEDRETQGSLAAIEKRLTFSILSRIEDRETRGHRGQARNSSSFSILSRIEDRETRIRSWTLGRAITFSILSRIEDRETPRMRRGGVGTALSASSLGSKTAKRRTTRPSRTSNGLSASSLGSKTAKQR